MLDNTRQSKPARWIGVERESTTSDVDLHITPNVVVVAFRCRTVDRSIGRYINGSIGRGSNRSTVESIEGRFGRSVDVLIGRTVECRGTSRCDGEESKVKSVDRWKVESVDQWSVESICNDG